MRYRLAVILYTWCYNAGVESATKFQVLYHMYRVVAVAVQYTQYRIDDHGHLRIYLTTAVPVIAAVIIHMNDTIYIIHMNDDVT